MPDLSTAQPGDVVTLTPDQIATAQPTLETAKPGDVVTLQPEQRRAAGIVDPLEDLSADELVKLTKDDPHNFDLLASFNSRPDLQKNPAMVAKVADAFHEIRKPLFEGVTAKGVLENLWNTFTGLARAGAHATGGTALILNSAGKVLVPGKEGEAQEDLAAGQKSLAELFSSAESSMFGLVSGASKLAGRAGRAIGISKSLDDYTPEDKVNALYDASAVHKTAGDLASGQGAVSQAVTGGEANAQPDPEEVGKLTDPFSWWALGAATKTAGAALPHAVAGAANLTGIAPDIAKGAAKLGIRGLGPELTSAEVAALPGQLAAKAGTQAANIIGNVASVVPQVGAATADLGAKIAPYAAFPGIVAIALAGHPHALWSLLAGGEHGVGHQAAKMLSTAATGMRQLSDFAKQVSGAVPMRSAYARAIREAIEIAPTAALPVAEGAAFDAAQLAAAETPQEREASVGLGVAFGLAGAGMKSAGHLLSGQIIAPRHFDVKAPIGTSGQYPQLNTIHTEQFGALVPQQKAWVNGVRIFLGQANPKADVFVTGDSPVKDVSSALQAAGVSPELADFSAKQEGATLHLPNGRTLVILKDAPAAPHEALHVIEQVVGETAMRQLDADVRARYSSTWEQFSRNYAAKLAGQDPGPGWRDVVLDKTGFGRVAAIDKLLRQTRQQFAQESRNTGAPMPSDAEVAGIVRQSFEGNGSDWRTVLTPEEAGEVADRYVSREHLAENFDAWFKHSGPTLEPGKQIPERIARTIGKTMAALGINPLRGRETDLGVTPSLETIQDLRTVIAPHLPEAAPAGAAPEVRAAVTPQTAGIPSTSQSAQEIAAQAPDSPAEGGTMTQRTVAEILAGSLSNNQGARLVYRSAPGEPAGAPAQKRATRRTIIEYSRTMPDAMKPLFQKLFFPWRADRQSGGDITWGGWVPEVFAANANRVAEWAAEGGHKAAIPYALDSAGRTFTPGGWVALHNDLQTFVHNQLAGRTGSGEPLVVPQNVREAGGYVPELGAAHERPLDQRKADFISMLFGTGQLPKTSRISNRGIGLPLSIAGEEVSAATMPGRTEVPVIPRGEFTGERAQQMGIEGRQIMEVNPVRAELERLGNLPKMLEAYQNLNLRNILSAEAAPEQPRFGANVLTLSAGFKPEGFKPGKETTKFPEKGLAFYAWLSPEGKFYKVPFFGHGPWAESKGTSSEALFKEGWSRVAASPGDSYRGIYASDNVPLTKAQKNALEDLGFERKQAVIKENDSGILIPSTKEFEPEYYGTPPHLPIQLKPSDERGAVKMAAVRDEESGKTFEGPMHAMALMDYLKWKHPERDEDTLALDAWNSHPGVTEGFTTNVPGEFLNREQAFQRATELKQYAARKGDDGSLESQAFERQQKLREAGYDVEKGAFKPAPNEEVRTLAKDYTEEAGLPYRPHTGYEPVNEARAKQVADDYEAAKHDPENPEVQKAYDAFKKETLDQWNFLKSKGVDFEPWTEKGQPYTTSAEMTADVRDNNHLYYFPTAAGYGEGGDVVAHPMLDSTGQEAAGKPVLYNDAFRAVHDFFGHAKEGYEFGPRGEYNAYLAHSKMYSPEANPAMAAETLGQNSWVNFGKHLRNAQGEVPRRGEAGFVAPAERPFAEQKATLLQDEGAAGAQFKPERKSKQDWELKETPGLFSKAWILPDGKPVQLGGQWHHEWVNENPDIAKRYGLKATTSGEENRVEALKKGFARINYARNQGTLTVEARAQDWPKLSASVKEMVRVNLPKIDNMDVHLLDAGAKKIVDQDGVALHTYDAHEKMDHLPLISEPSSTTTMSAQATAERGQFTPKNRADKKEKGYAATEYWAGPEGLRPAPYGHEQGAVDYLNARHPELRAEHSGGDEETVQQRDANYRDMEDRGWARVTRLPKAIEVDGTNQVLRFGELPKSARAALEDMAFEHNLPVKFDGETVIEKPRPDESGAQFKPSLTAPEPEEFKDIRTLPAALAKPNWALFTATEESKGAGTDEVNVKANEKLKADLIKAGFDPVPVQGNYKGVDQGLNFLVTGMTPKEAQEWGKKYNQESVLTPDGLLYQNGEVHPVEPTEHVFGEEAKQQDFHSQIEGGPAFSMGIDFSNKVPLAEARKPFEVRGPVTAGKVNPKTVRGRQRGAAESETLSLQHVLDNPDMEDFAKTVAERIKKIPGFKNISLKNMPEALKEIADRMAQNIKFLYDRATPENRELWRTWYDLAKQMTERWGPEYGFHPDVIAAVNARLSPQTDWYNNVTLTRAVLDTFKNDPAFTEADRSFAKGKIKKIVDTKERKRMLGELDGIKTGDKLSELNDLQAGILLRSHNETTRSLLTHDHNLKLTGDFTSWGKPWDDLRSVISILRNPSYENVDRELGNNHKVRSFYNNHVVPNSPYWVTIDTHAGAAATMMPFGSTDAATQDIFGNPKHKASGYNGTYFLYQHAYEQVAKELGILPRELQSIVWEQIRQDLSPEAKRSLQNADFEPILKIHKAIDAGTMTPQQGREAIVEEFHRHGVPAAERNQQDLGIDIQPRRG